MDFAFFTHGEAGDAAQLFRVFGIRTNEEKSYLWKKMSEIYSSMGAVYSPMELKKEFRRLTLIDRVRVKAQSRAVF